jgi:tetratricopeptide (TPR) repeat protein
MWTSGNWKMPSGQAKRSVELAPDRGYLCGYLAGVHAIRQESELARTELERAVKLDPQAAVIRIKLGELCIEAEFYEKVLEHFDVLVRWDRMNPHFNMYRGLAQLRLKQWDRAQKSLMLSVTMGGPVACHAFLIEAHQGLGEIEKYLVQATDPKEREAVEALLSLLRKRP